MIKLGIMKQVMAVFLCLAMLTACPSTNVVLDDLSLIIQTSNVIGDAVSLISPEDGAIAKKIGTMASQSLTVVQTDYQDYLKSGAVSDLDKTKAAAQAIEDSLPEELTAAQVTNPKSVAAITGWVDTVVDTLKVILNALPATKTGGKKAGNLPTHQSIKSKWDIKVCDNDKTCSALVK